MAASNQDKAVFLCHAGENKAFVRQLVDRLETDGLKKDQIFYDEISLQPGDELDSIIKVIESPSLKLFVFVVSKYCFQSNKTWIRAEWEAALVNNRRILPIWLDDNNDGFKAFGNLVREFSYKLRKVIAQKVNPQEISTSLPGLSEKICSLVCGDQPTQIRPTSCNVDALLGQRPNILPDVLPAKLKIEFVQKVYNQLLDKAEALFDDDTLNDEERLKKADKIFSRYKARIESIIPRGCFILNLRFFQPCNVDEFYHDHFRVGPASLSAALSRFLITDQMRAAAGGEELMVRVEVRYDDYIKVRRQLCMTGILKATSLDNLSTMMRSCTERHLENPNLEVLDLAITSTQDVSFTEWVTYPGTRHLADRVRQKSQQLIALERKLEVAKHSAGIHEDTVRSLHKEVTRLNKKDENAQKVLLNKTEEIEQLQETIRDLKSEIEGFRNAKSQQFTDLEGKLAMARRQAEIQEDIVKSLQKEVTLLNKKDEAVQKVLLNKTKEIRQLHETIGNLQLENEELRNAKAKWPVMGSEEVSAQRATEGGASADELSPEEESGQDEQSASSEGDTSATVPQQPQQGLYPNLPTHGQGGMMVLAQAPRPYDWVSSTVAGPTAGAALENDCAILVTGFSATPIKEHLELYFESKKKGGGEIKDIQIRGKKAFVAFEDAAVHHQVLSRQHTIAGVAVTVEEVPGSVMQLDKTRLLVKGFKDSTTEELLGLYMELLSGGRVTRVDYGAQPGVALITLDRISNFDQILAKAKTKGLDGKTLTIERVPVTDAILVTDLPDNASEDLVKLYFESERRSGGGPVSEVEMNSPRQKAVIHFKNPATVNQITSRSHNLNNISITVKPYYEYLGDVLDSNEEDSADSIDPAAMETSSPVPIFEASSPARESPTAMDVSSTPVKQPKAPEGTADSPSMHQEILNPAEEARKKGPSVTQAVKLDRNKLKLLLLSDFAASHPDVEVKINMEQKEVKLTGEDHAVMAAKLHVYETTQNPAEEKVKISRGIAAFLTTEKGRMHFEGCLQGNQLKVAFLVEEERVSFFALKSEDVEKAKRVMTQCVSESSIPFDADSSDVLKSKEATSLFKDLQEKHLVCINLGNKRVWVVGPPHDLAIVKEDISTFVSTNTIITVTVDTSECCMKFLQEYKKDYIAKVERQHTEQAVKITSRNTGGFSIKGTKDGIRDAKRKLEKLVADVKKVSKKIAKPGMHKFLTGDTGRALLDVAGRDNQCLIIPDVPSRGRGGAKTLCSHTIRQGKKLVVVHGDITKQTVDVIVNAANDNLRHGGGVAGAIARAGGPQIQQDCDKYVQDSGPLADGEVMTTKGYSLPCKMVVHAVGPQWSRDMSDVEKQAKEALLKHTVYKSMEAAKDHHSIAIPGISSGIYGYPMDLCAAAILHSVQNFFQVNHACTLTEVHLIEMDSRKADTFQQEFVKRFGKDKLTIPGPGSTSASKKGGAAAPSAADNALSGPGGVKILLKQGDITKEQVDVLVNNTGSTLSLSHGGVSSAFGKAGGQQLQQLCNNHGQAKPGDVVVTPAAGRLSCREVYHAVLYGMTDRNPQKKLIFTCLINASQSGHSSIAFPAIGTGNMGFRMSEVAESMYDAILSFYHRNHGCSVKDVRIIVFDQPTVKAFEKELKNRHEGSKAPEAAAPTTGGRGTEIYSAVRKPQPGVQEMDIAAVTVQVKTGDITAERVDAIVNPTGNDLGLGGGMAKVVSDAAGRGLQVECQQYIQQNGNLGNGSVVVTGGHNLPCSNVIHLTSPNNPDQLRGYVKKVLVVAEKTNLKSVALPALGTGGFNVGADKSAFCLLGGIADFVRDSNPTSVKEVRITIFQQKMLQDFHSEMDRRAAMAGHSGPGFFTRAARFFGFGSADADNPASWPLAAPRPARNVSFPASNPKELTLLLFGPDQTRLDRARKDVDNIVERNCKEEKIQNAGVTMLTQQEARMIHTYGEDRDVVVKRGSGIDCLLIQGGIHDVTQVLKKIWTVLNAKVEEQRDLERAHSVQKDAQWSYVVAQGREQKIHPAANAQIEAAFKAKKSSVKYDDDNEDCEIDFKTMIVTMKPSKRSFPVQRRDKRAEAGGGALPTTWDPQPQDRGTKKPKICQIVSLKSGSQEYTTVSRKFTNSLGGMKATIVSIERVQNPTLWTQYCAQRQKISQINPRRKVEQELWHGTKQEVTEKINHNGFNRSYSGGNVGCWEGQGSYFALKAAYSTKDYYSAPDPATKHKKMFLCKVTTGEYTKGTPDLKNAPMRTDKPNVPFDSTVNDVNNPTVFVIFHDAQAYPEYLITFKMS